MIIFHRGKKELLFVIIFIDLFLFLEKSTLQYADNNTLHATADDIEVVL